jgi:hypothetical protein
MLHKLCLSIFYLYILWFYTTQQGCLTWNEFSWTEYSAHFNGSTACIHPPFLKSEEFTSSYVCSTHMFHVLTVTTIICTFTNNLVLSVLHEQNHFSCMVVTKRKTKNNFIFVEFYTRTSGEINVLQNKFVTIIIIFLSLSSSSSSSLLSPLCRVFTIMYLK